MVNLLCLTSTNVRHWFQLVSPDTSPREEAEQHSDVEFGLVGNALRGVLEVHLHLCLSPPICCTSYVPMCVCEVGGYHDIFWQGSAIMNHES